jgi:hypothetical protein
MGDENKRNATSRDSLSLMLRLNQTLEPMTPSTEQYAVAQTSALSNGWNSSHLGTTPCAPQVTMPRGVQQSNVRNSASLDVASLLGSARNSNSSRAPQANDTAFSSMSPQGTAKGSALGSSALTPQGTANGSALGPQGTANGSALGSSALTPQGSENGSALGSSALTPQGLENGSALGSLSAGWTDRPTSHSTLVLPAPAQPLLLPLVVNEHNWRLLLEAFPAQLALIQANIAPPFTSRDLSTLLDIVRFALLDTSTAGAIALRQLHNVLSAVASLPSQQLELSMLDWESLVLVSRSVLGSLPSVP